MMIKDSLLRVVMNNKFLKSLLRPVYIAGQKPLLLKQNFIFKKYRYEALKKLQEAFDKENILFWLEFGTLLGAVREHYFLEHDLDIDIGLFIDNDSKKIENILLRAGFFKQQQIEIDNGIFGLEQSYRYKGVTIDLFYFTKKDSKMSCHVFTNQYGISWERSIKEGLGLIVYEHTFSFNGFEEIDFLDIRLKIPKNSHIHLQEQYGEGYLKKDKNWNPYKMATNKIVLENKKGFVK